MAKKNICDICLIPAYIKKQDGHWWKRDFWTIIGDHWQSIKKWQVPLVAIEYFFRGRRKLKIYLEHQRQVSGVSWKEATEIAGKYGYLT